MTIKRKQTQRVAKLVKITTNNQVAIPSSVVRKLRLAKGVYLEVQAKGRQIIMTPKHIVDDEDFTMYQEVIRKGRTELARGETVDWDDVKKKLDQQK